MHLYIGNLSHSVTEEDLLWIFGGVGEIVFARLCEGDRDPNRRGYAFIHISDPKQAMAAAKGLNGSYLKGLRLIVRPVMDHRRQARVLRASPYALNRRSGEVTPEPEASI
ncbi:MAG: RNA recognition motif domain-containing protein [Acidiferrobacteraceae bacterium]